MGFGLTLRPAAVAHQHLSLGIFERVLPVCKPYMISSISVLPPNTLPDAINGSYQLLVVEGYCRCVADLQQD